MSRKFLDWTDIIHNTRQLPKYQPFTSKQIHFVNFTTTNEALDELIYFAKQVNYFVIETKYDYKLGYDNESPALIQILFDYNMTFHVILVDAQYLIKYRDEDEYYSDWQYNSLQSQIQHLFSIILSSSNSIYSWTNIKSDLKWYLHLNFFTVEHIDKMIVYNIRELFEEWVLHDFTCHENKYKKTICWTLEMAAGFMFRKRLDTRISKCKLWGLGLFLQHDNNREDELLFQELFAGNVTLANEHRYVLTEFAVNECIAIHTIFSCLRDDSMKKKTFERMELLYGKM